MGALSSPSGFATLRAPLRSAPACCAVSLQSRSAFSTQNIRLSYTHRLQVFNNTFSALLTTFQQAEEQIKVATQTKILANNTLNNKLMEICLDGQIIYKQNEPIKDQFTFATILQIVSGTGTTGFKGYIINASVNLPIPGATITTTPPSKTAITNSEGFYEIIQIPTAIYTIQITAPGFIPQSIPNYQVDTGITHNLSIPLQPQP